LKQRYASFCQETFNQGLENSDVTMIQFSLERAAVISELIKKFNINISSSTNKEIVLMRFIVETRIDSYLKEFSEPQFLKIDQNSKIFQSDFEAFFENLNNKYKFLKEVNTHLQNQFPQNNFTNLESDCVNSLNKNINEQFSSAEMNLNEILIAPEILQNDLNDFFTHYYNVKSFEKKMNNAFIKNRKRKIESSLLEKIIKQIDTMSESITTKDLEAASHIFIRVKTYSNRLYVFKESIDEKLDKIMNVYIEKNGGFEIIGKLGMLLKKNIDGSRILTEHKCFEAHNRSLFNRKTLSQDIDYVLKDLRGDAIDEKKLASSYRAFKTKFDSLIEDYLYPKIDFDTFKSNLSLFVSNILKNTNNGEWTEKTLEDLPILIAHIFALWTLLNAGQYFQMQGDKKTFLFLPHPAQVVSIFRILGIGYEIDKMKILKEKFNLTQKDLSLKKNFVQIGTGEGKSVTLAVTAVVLSILGFDVYCVCYSDYLSKRDYNAFKILFDVLELKKFIHYGTFNKICEDEINKEGDVRKIVEDLILEGKLSNINEQKQASLRPRVLLIDEVDVFFSKDFYGNSYRPSLNLSDKTINDLISLIWKERKNEGK
jgi:hypothetical protein